MSKNLIYFLSVIALAAGAMSTEAQTSVATVPEGQITFPLPHGTTSFLSVPLTNNSVYTGQITAVTANTISVGDSPAPFTSNLATPSAPYFMKLLTGTEIGRVMLITANTASSLTLDTTDNTSQTVGLTTSGFSVRTGDSFEIFPAYTLASMFGDNSAQNPLVLAGSASIFTADSVSIYSPFLVRWQAYYFNTTAGCWQLIGSSANANNTILYPYGALTIARRANEADASLVLTGRVTKVPILTKTTGSNSAIYGSTGYASDMTLSQLQFGSNWNTGASGLTANTVSVWNATLSQFDTYYQKPDSTWRKSSDADTDQSNVVIIAGADLCILQRGTVSGAASFLSSVLPYSLN